MRFKLSIKKGLIYCLIAMLTFGYPTITLEHSVLALDGTTTANVVDTTATGPSAIQDTTTTVPVATTTAAPVSTDTTTDISATPTTTTNETLTLPVSVAPVTTPVVQDATLASDTTNVVDPGAPSAPAASADSAVSSTPPTTTANTIETTTISTAKSGDASVIKNITAGNATTGGALATDTVLNNINSSTGGGMVSFTSNVTGDVTGDIQLYPMIIGALSSGGVISSPTNVPSVVSNTNNQITNNISLNAASGTAMVSDNITAGNATTGNASTVVNIMNIVNSMISTNQSFVGVINIYGNLNGDILIAPDFIPQLLASNAAATSSAATAGVVDNSQIINNISLNATSGTATVGGNVAAGSATSGSALTNLVLINLSGHQVIASNSLLVFVNVLGKWVGVIVDAPAGSTAAAIGSGVTQNTAAALLPAVSPTINSVITNNVTLNSQTGDASVMRNVQAGNAVTGNASASANVLNMTQSNFGLSGWFGVLFINVFGSWFGSFGINTGNGTIPLATDSPAISQSPSAAPVAVKFIPKVAILQSSRSVVDVEQVPTISQPVDTTMALSAVLGAQSTPNQPVIQPYNYTLAAFIALAILAVIIRRIWIAVVAKRHIA